MVTTNEIIALIDESDKENCILEGVIKGAIGRLSDDGSLCDALTFQFERMNARNRQKDEMLKILCDLIKTK